MNESPHGLMSTACPNQGACGSKTHKFGSERYNHCLKMSQSGSKAKTGAEAKTTDFASVAAAPVVDIEASELVDFLRGRGVDIGIDISDALQDVHLHEDQVRGFFWGENIDNRYGPEPIHSFLQDEAKLRFDDHAKELLARYEKESGQIIPFDPILLEEISAEVDIASNQPGRDIDSVVDEKINEAFERNGNYMLFASPYYNTTAIEAAGDQTLPDNWREMTTDDLTDQQVADWFTKTRDWYHDPNTSDLADRIGQWRGKASDHNVPLGSLEMSVLFTPSCATDWANHDPGRFTTGELTNEPDVFLVGHHKEDESRVAFMFPLETPDEKTIDVYLANGDESSCRLTTGDIKGTAENILVNGG